MLILIILFFADMALEATTSPSILSLALLDLPCISPLACFMLPDKSPALLLLILNISFFAPFITAIFVGGCCCSGTGAIGSIATGADTALGADTGTDFGAITGTIRGVATFTGAKVGLANGTTLGADVRTDNGIFTGATLGGTCGTDLGVITGATLGTDLGAATGTDLGTVTGKDLGVRTGAGTPLLSSSIQSPVAEIPTQSPSNRLEQSKLKSNTVSEIVWIVQLSQKSLTATGLLGFTITVHEHEFSIRASLLLQVTATKLSIPNVTESPLGNSTASGDGVL
jgi:hypothetical protein